MRVDEEGARNKEGEKQTIFVIGLEFSTVWIMWNVQYRKQLKRYNQKGKKKEAIPHENKTRITGLLWVG